ncbi:TadE/TadG family type IV pilus assembly protein [Rhizobium sp. G21]|uniref:TadE/TadG family type IV pilus assembly protein n=1 Tax=Rhizobium sp. G21 TaxID=2758439 RepID=UPI0015FFC0B5|nr:vWA domain-containing protein [Rhizobium sp. G21]MBB1247984.1 VWA domain-containing protein [Rhizobium sp. G21]
MKTPTSMLVDRSGNFALMAALVATPVIMASGIAIDMITAYTTRTEMQNAADAAVLAAASSGETEPTVLETIAKNSFEANFKSAFASEVRITDFTVSSDNRITLKASARTPLTLAKIIRPDGIDVKILSQAQSGSEDDIEIALALDNTYSMTGQKLTDLKAASNALLDVFEKMDAKQKKARFSIVPFSRYVNVGMSYRNASWLDVKDDYSTTARVCTKSRPVVSQSGCTTEKKTGYNDGVPYTYDQKVCSNTVYGDEVETCSNKTTNYKWSGCVGSRTNPLDTQDISPDKKYPGLMNIKCGAAITTLTSDYTKLRAAIKAMVANDETYIAPGVLWGWNTLSQGEPFTDGKAYDADVKKFIIIMTDGTNTVSPTYPTHTKKDTVKSNTLMSTVCQNAKNKGVTIFTVAVGIDKSSSTAVELGKCASDADKAVLVQNRIR